MQSPSTSENSPPLTPATEAPPLNRVEEVWYDDGNLIIQAGHSLFRVYKGLLASRSAMLAEILSQPLGEERGQDLIEGQPVVEFHDSPDDMCYFLRAIFESGYFEVDRETTFPILAGILRLSTKYDIGYLRRRATIHLATAYPLSLQAWDRRELKRTIPPIPYIPFAVLELARAVNIPVILPAAIYCCCTCSVEDILDGVPWGGDQLNMSPKDQRLCDNRPL